MTLVGVKMNTFNEMGEVIVFCPSGFWFYRKDIFYSTREEELLFMFRINGTFSCVLQEGRAFIALFCKAWQQCCWAWFFFCREAVDWKEFLERH